MDRDELVDTIVGLSETVDDQQARLEAFSRWKETTTGRLADVTEQNERLREENEQLRERLDAIEAKADQALTAASGGDPDDRTDTEHARVLTRNILVTDAAEFTDEQTVAKVTIAQVRDRAKPQRSLKWQTVRNAWDDLLGEWPSFREGQKDGQQALTLPKQNATKALVRTVERDLGRDDLAKRFVGEKTGDQP